jgi:iron complex transport system substrate-binding protein
LRSALVLAAVLPLAAAPARIVSTAPSITEMLYALGLGPRVVGVTRYCEYPPEAKTKPKIGTFLEPDYERILALKPDLVLVIKNPVQAAEKLHGLGLRAEEIDQDSVADIYRSLERIGGLTGRAEAARKLVARLRGDLDRIRASVAGRPPASVLFLVGRAPGTLQDMVGCGPGTFLDELLTLAGGANVLARSPILYPKVSMENIMAADPDVIIDMGDYAHAQQATEHRRRQELALWSAYPHLRAVRSHRVFAVTSSAFVVPGPRMVEAARAFRDFLHPGVKP